MILKTIFAKKTEFIQDQKGPHQATFGGKDMKLDKRIKRHLCREESTEKRAKASESERELLKGVKHPAEIMCKR